MSLDALIIFAGALIAILPFLGFPVSWDHPIFFILGICVIVLGIVVRRRLSHKGHQEGIAFNATHIEEQ
jgi:hypothetical protein